MTEMNREAFWNYLVSSRTTSFQHFKVFGE